MSWIDRSLCMNPRQTLAAGSTRPPWEVEEVESRRGRGGTGWASRRQVALACSPPLQCMPVGGSGTGRCSECGSEMVSEQSTFQQPHWCGRGGDDGPDQMFFLVAYGRWRCPTCPSRRSPREALPTLELLNELRERWKRRTYILHDGQWRASITDYDVRRKGKPIRSRTCPEGRWPVDCRNASLRDGRVKLILSAAAHGETHKVPIELPMSRSRFSPFGMLACRWLKQPDDADLPASVEDNWELVRKTLERRSALMYIGRDSNQGFALVDVEPLSPPPS